MNDNKKMIKENNMFKDWWSEEDTYQSSSFLDEEMKKDYNSILMIAKEHYDHKEYLAAVDLMEELHTAYRDFKYQPTADYYILFGQLLEVKEKYENAMKMYYKAYTSLEILEGDKLEVLKAITRVGEKLNLLHKIYCIYSSYKDSYFHFIRMDTKEMIRVKDIDLLMWDIMPYDFINLVLCEVKPNVEIVSNVELLKRPPREVVDKAKEKAVNLAEMKDTLQLKKNVENERVQNMQIQTVTPISLKVKKLNAYEGDLPYIFVSYAHKDSDLALQIIESLQKRGYRIWFDQGIEVGTEWPRFIGEHISNCACLLSLMSPNAEVSSNCRSEITLADKKKKDIIVAYLEDFEIQDAGLELLLVLLHAIYFSRHENLDSFIDELCLSKSMLKCKE